MTPAAIENVGPLHRHKGILHLALGIRLLPTRSQASRTSCPYCRMKICCREGAISTVLAAGF